MFMLLYRGRPWTSTRLSDPHFKVFYRSSLPRGLVLMAESYGRAPLASEVQKLLEGLLCLKEPGMRFTAQRSLQSPWFADTRLEPVPVHAEMACMGDMAIRTEPPTSTLKNQSDASPVCQHMPVQHDETTHRCHQHGCDEAGACARWKAGSTGTPPRAQLGFGSSLGSVLLEELFNYDLRWPRLWRIVQWRSVAVVCVLWSWMIIDALCLGYFDACVQTSFSDAEGYSRNCYSTWLNRWTNSYRMHDPVRLTCIFGCQTCQNSSSSWSPSSSCSHDSSTCAATRAATPCLFSMPLQPWLCSIQ